MTAIGRDGSESERRRAFLEVLERYGPPLRRLCGVYADSRDDREDLFQEICLALWRALPQFRGEASLRTFVYRVGHNRGLTFRAQARRREAPLGDQGRPGDTEPVSPDPPADETADTGQRVEALRRAIRGLPPLLREVIVLRLEGLSTPEAAAVLGITENNAAVRLTRARTALRDRLPHLAED